MKVRAIATSVQQWKPCGSDVDLGPNSSGHRTGSLDAT